jgi:DNA-binding MarR family transcriptional regulator
MQKNGLVTKKKDKKRGNVVRISIRKKGREVCQQVMGQDLIHQIMSSLSDEQREHLRECLSILYAEALKELGIEGELPLLSET